MTYHMKNDYPDDLIEQIKGHKRRGGTIRGYADEHGYDYKALLKYLNRSGIFLRPRDRDSFVTIGVAISPDDRDALMRYCKRRNISASAVLRGCVMALLGHDREEVA
jgi:hypothetical protein